MRGPASCVFRLSLAVVAAIAACVVQPTTGKPTMPRMREIIADMLQEDKVYESLLSEKIKLSVAEVPPSVRYVLSDKNNVDPLVALHDLMKIGGGVEGGTYSGDALALATTIVGTAIRCLLLKRVVVQLLFALRMAELDADKKDRVSRVLVFAYLVPRELDVLSSFGKRYVELLKVYDAISVIRSDQTDWTVKDGHEERLAEQLQALNDAVAGSCVVSAANEYYANMGLKAADPKDHPIVITAEQKVAANLTLPVVVDLLKENENALLDFYDDMSLLKNLGLGAWKALLKSPDLTPNAKDFKRIKRTTYYEDVTKVLGKSWIDLPADGASADKAQI